MILTNALSVNNDRIDIDPGAIEVVYENSSVVGGCVIVLKNGETYLVREDFETIRRLRDDAATQSTGT